MYAPVMITRRSQTGGRGASEHGFSLIEVLVALLVLSIGLLGLAMLQVQGMRANSDAYFRTQATILAYDLIDRMRANSAGAELGDYTASSAPSSPPNCGSGGCAASDRAKRDLYKWYQEVASSLPGYQASVSAPSSNMITISISWTDRNITEGQTWQIQV